MRRTERIKPQRIMIISFALLILVGTVLLFLPTASKNNESVGFLNALFTATSAVCVTGLTVVEIESHFSLFGQIVIMVLVQIGGLGYMTFGVLLALLLGKRITLRERLLLQAWNHAFSLQGLARLTLSILVMAVVFQSLATILLALRWFSQLGGTKAIYYALFHAIMGFNSAGFSLFPDSLHTYAGDPYITGIISLLMIIGGIGFTVLVDLYHKRSWKKLTLHSKLVLSTSFFLTVGGWILILLVESSNPATLGSLSWTERLFVAWFQAVTPRSGGFSTIDTGALMTTTLLLTIFFMFIGSGTGSTGGGIKVNTFAVLIITLVNVVKGNRDVNVFKRRISHQVVVQAIAVIMLSLGVILLVTLLLTATEQATHHHFLAILFETTSAFGTVGLSMGLTPELSPAGKLIMTATMFVGRLGPLTFAFAIAFRSAENRLHYPEEKVLIG